MASSSSSNLAGIISHAKHSAGGGGGFIPTTTSAQLNAVPVISTLQTQQYQAGKRLLLFLETRAYLEGGIESILKQIKAHQKQAGLTSGGGGTSGSSSDLLSTEQLLEESPDDDFDAFNFLQDDDDEEEEGAAAAAPEGTTETESGGKKKKGLGGFLKKVAASTTATLDRQMQGLAVRLDKGRNADLVRVAMYTTNTTSTSGAVEEQLIGVTEGQDYDGSSRTPLRFKIPLTLYDPSQPIVLKVWIQSGAALLKTTKAARCYLLGQATLNPLGLTPSKVQGFPLASNLLVDASIQVYACPDPKFAPLHARGWSLTDPDVSKAYASSHLHNLPLDQSYQFPHPNHNNSRHWMTGVERATESTMVLPLAAAVMDHAHKACIASLHHAQSVGNVLRANRHDQKDATKATCSIGIVGVCSETISAQSATISLGWRRPDSIFELELIANQAIPLTAPNVAAAFPALQTKLYPKLCKDNILPGVLQALNGKMPPSGYLMGGLFFSVTMTGVEQVEVWECKLGIESFIDHPPNQTLQIPLWKQGQSMGKLLVQIHVTLPANPGTPRVLPATDGLISLVGLETWQDGVAPKLDADANTPPVEPTLRHQQLDTMGLFCTVQYMDQHIALRQSAVDQFYDRAQAYKQALRSPSETPQPHTTRVPKGFRPSSSRSEALLSGLPFNCHNVTLALTVQDDNTMSHQTTSSHGNRTPQGALFHNITCGAPSDHARGFGNVLSSIPGSRTNVSGGLRRLEKKRWECALALQQAQSLLIAGVGNYLATARQSGQVNHVPSRHAEIQSLRWRVFECVHNLHHVTWMCAVRRANVFAQSLGLAVSSYLAAVSDTGRCAAGWPELWKRHGYLVGFEGLLSAAGKELGMIEDASVAISMLRMVRVVLMPDQGTPSKAVAVPASPYLRWVNLFASGAGGQRHFLLQIGVDSNYYQHLPPPLQNGAAIQMFPLLFEVGVDIRQWSVNTGGSAFKGTKEEMASITEDEDDDIGIQDADVLVDLNYEALRKLNAYAHAVNPQALSLDKVQSAMIQVFVNPNDQKEILPVHPSLASLHEHVISSAGKMNHAILDEAAMLCQRLGGGGVVFCKSGKDRTAMHITYKQAQFAAQYRGISIEDEESILRDATLIRVYGTRLPICEKNVGESKYAFNSLQVKFMPDELKPPANTLAGFKLKIES